MKSETAARLRILLLEDNPADAELVLYELQRAGIDAETVRVVTREDFEARLDPCPDLILSDYHLPLWDGLLALRLVRERGLDIPFIIVSGTIGEDLAVDAMRHGADDYLLKDRLSRLGTAVTQALDRKRLEKARALAEREFERVKARYQLIFDHAAAGIILSTIKGAILAINPAGATMLGYGSPDEVVAAVTDISAQLYADPRERDAVRERMAREGQVRDFALQYKRKDGSTVPVSQTTRVLDEMYEGRKLAITIVQDMTERKRAEEMLRVQRARLAGLIDSAMDAVVTVDSAQRITLFNPAAERMFGIPSTQMIGQPLDRLIPERHRPCHSEHISDFGLKGVSNRQAGILGVVTGLRANGEEFSLEASISQIDVDGQKYYTAILRDITERKLGEQLLRESEGKYRSLIEQASDGIFLTDIEGNYVLVNARGCELLGYTETELLGLNARDTYIEEEREIHASHVERVRAGETVRFERMVRRKDGSAFLAEISAKMLDNGLIQVIFHDITARREAEALVRESELRFRSFVEQSPDAMIIHQAGRIVFVNAAMVRLMRAGETGTLLGKPGISLLHAGHVDIAEQRQARLYSGQTVPLVDQVYVRSDGTTVDVEAAASPIVLDGKPAALVTVREITERKEQERRIARLSRIHAVLSGINSAIVRIRDRKELFLEACRIAIEHGGFSLGWIAVLDKASGKLVPVAQAGLPMDFGAGGDTSNGPAGLMPGGTAEVALREKQPAFDNDIERGLGEMGSELGPETLSLRRAAVRLGAKSVIVLPLFVEGKTFGILSLYAPERNFFDDEEIKLLTELAGDISFGLEFIAKEEKVDYLAYYDALTGLPNRTLFFDRLTHQLGSAKRDGSNVALIVMDMDRFRLINDTLGRQAGDALIGAVAQRIKDTFRDQDTVARVGADSFAVAISGTWRAPNASRVLESHNRQLFGQPFLIGKEALRVSASAGVAVFPGDGDSPETLFANAEAALRKAKGQNAHLLFYSPDMNARIADSLRLENRLRQALDNGEMVLWYQPKVSVSTRKLIGFEALMRWRDPESTLMLPPAKFIPLMEQTGLILEAGTWAMSQVARDCKLWANAGFKPPRVAVNVSPIQLRQKDFVATVAGAAQKTREAGGLLDLEITESVIMENVEAIIPTLQTLRGLGVDIAVDDFGTGYSSLAYIARLPLHDLKIDRSFIVGMTQNEDSLAIVKSVISLAHSLRLNVVAEGVETEEQAALLLKLGCDEMQGYLISRPAPPEEVIALLRSQEQDKTDVPRRKTSAIVGKTKGMKNRM